MSAEFGMALCALICIVVLGVVLGIDSEMTKANIDGLGKEIEHICNIQANLIKRIDQNSESCSKVNDLGIEIKVCQKDIEHALEMIEELKAKRSMDVLDELREEDKK